MPWPPHQHRPPRSGCPSPGHTSDVEVPSRLRAVDRCEHEGNGVSVSFSFFVGSKLRRREPRERRAGHSEDGPARACSAPQSRTEPVCPVGSAHEPNFGRTVGCFFIT